MSTQILIERTCAVCAKSFKTLELNQHKCAACCDAGKEAKHITTERVCLQEFEAVKLSLSPSLFSAYKTDDKNAVPSLRLILKGKDLGWGAPQTMWNGRMDIYINFRRGNGQTLWPIGAPAPTSFPKYVRFRLMHVKKAAQTEKAANSKYSSPLKFTDEWDYIALDPLPDTTVTDKELVLVTASYKTTLKGFGRQWHTRLESNALWEFGMSGTCRSGRFGHNSVLAIVDKDHPVIYLDDECEKKYYPACAEEIPQEVLAE